MFLLSRRRGSTRTSLTTPTETNSPVRAEVGVSVFTQTLHGARTLLLYQNSSVAVEFMFIKCRPYCLPREYTSVCIVAVYIPPSANAQDDLNEWHDAICKQQAKHPKAFFIVLGDFSHANLKAVLPRLQQHVKTATRGETTLDKAYTTSKGAYKASLPHLGSSDHTSVMLLSVYRPQVKLVRPVKKTGKSVVRGEHLCLTGLYGNH